MKVIDMFDTISSGNDSVPVEHRCVPPRTSIPKNLARATTPNACHRHFSLFVLQPLDSSSTHPPLLHFHSRPSAGFRELLNALVDTSGFNIFIDTVS